MIGTTSSNCSVAGSATRRSSASSVSASLNGKADEIRESPELWSLTDHDEERLALGQLLTGHRRSADDVARVGLVVTAVQLDVDVPVEPLRQPRRVALREPDELGDFMGRRPEQAVREVGQPSERDEHEDGDDRSQPATPRPFTTLIGCVDRRRHGGTDRVLRPAAGVRASAASSSMVASTSPSYSSACEGGSGLPSSDGGIPGASLRVGRRQYHWWGEVLLRLDGVRHLGGGDDGLLLDDRFLLWRPAAPRRPVPPRRRARIRIPFPPAPPARRRRQLRARRRFRTRTTPRARRQSRARQRSPARRQAAAPWQPPSRCQQSLLQSRRSTQQRQQRRPQLRRARSVNPPAGARRPSGRSVGAACRPRARWWRGRESARGGAGSRRCARAPARTRPPSTAPPAPGDRPVRAPTPADRDRPTPA